MPAPEIHNHRVQNTAPLLLCRQHTCLYKSVSTEVWAGSQGLRVGGLFLTNAQPVNQGSPGSPWHSSGLAPRRRIQVIGGFWRNVCPWREEDSTACWGGPQGRRKGRLEQGRPEPQLPAAARPSAGCTPPGGGKGSEAPGGLGRFCFSPKSPDPLLSPCLAPVEASSVGGAEGGGRTESPAQRVGVGTQRVAGISPPTSKPSLLGSPPHSKRKGSVRPGTHLELGGKGVPLGHPGQDGAGAAGHRAGGGSSVCVSTRPITWSSSAGRAAPSASP